MKKFLTLTISLAVFINLSLYGQKDKNTNSNGNSDQGRTNLLLPHGNIGINTLEPGERLEVIGNVRVSNTIFSQDLEVIGLSSTNISVREDINVGRNLLVNGNVGIGVVSPSERLEINGNLRVSNGIFSDKLEVTSFTAGNGTVTQGLLIKQNFTVEGLTGLGVPSPVERLEVEGNIKATQNLISTGLQTQTGSFSSNVEIGENLVVNGNTGLGISNPTERLEINGNLKVSNGIFTQTLEGSTLNIDNGTVNNQLSINGNTLVNGNTGLGVTNPGERLEVEGNLKVSNTIFTSSLQSNELTLENGAINGQLSVGGNTLINGNVGIGTTEPIEKLEVAGNIKATGNFTATGLFASQGNFAGNVNVNQNLAVSGNSSFTGAVTTGDLTVLNTLDLKNGLSIGGSLGIGVATPTIALHVAGDGKFDGNITAVKLIVQELEVANLDMGSGEGGQISFDDNLFVEGSVGIGTQNIEGYTLSVNGKIRASDDIKVYPSTEWADFVFDDQYELRPLKDVEAYIAKNNHLPGIPSAEDVKENGISLGEMDARLLLKVEELTLYMIALKKENDQLKMEMKTIKEEVTGKR